MHITNVSQNAAHNKRAHAISNLKDISPHLNDANYNHLFSLPFFILYPEWLAGLLDVRRE